MTHSATAPVRVPFRFPVLKQRPSLVLELSSYRTNSEVNNHPSEGDGGMATKVIQGQFGTIAILKPMIPSTRQDKEKFYDACLELMKQAQKSPE